MKLLSTGPQDAACAVLLVLWLEDGDHDLKPRKKVSGISAADHLRAMARAVQEWSVRLPSR